MKKEVLVTRDSIQAMLDSDNEAYVAEVIGRGLIGLLDRQTTDEQVSIGFTGADAFSGSLTAKFWRKHGKLLDWQIAKWTKKGKNGYSRLCKYHKQLNEIALARTNR